LTGSRKSRDAASCRCVSLSIDRSRICRITLRNPQQDGGVGTADFDYACAIHQDGETVLFIPTPLKAHVRPHRVNICQAITAHANHATTNANVRTQDSLARYASA
jgi:hypothetical protein